MVDQPPAIQERQVDFWDKENPRALLQILPKAIAEKVEDAHFEKSELFGMDERQLYKVLREANCQPGATDNRLRLSFWLEYDRAQAEVREMRTANIVAGVCAPSYFTDKYLKQPVKVAWLLTPPASYVVVAEEALQFGLERLRDILSIDPAEDPKKLNVKLMSLQMKIVEYLDTRKHGIPTQKVAHFHANAKAAEAAGEAETMEQLQARIKAVEYSLAQRGGNVVVVDSEQS